MKRKVYVPIHLLWIFIFINQYLFVVRGQSCSTRAWFGDNCQYKCHCTGNNCDFTTGECTGGSACVKGWFGPTCQYVDLTTTMTTGTGWLFDGDDTTCNDEQTTSVTVELNDAIHFTWLRLYVKDTGNRDTFNIQFQTSPTGNDMICNNKRTAAVGDQTFDIYCDLDKLVQQVTITGEGVGSLCSVYISGGRNVALKQPTSQSSTYPRGSSLVSSNAVDGNRDGSWYSGSCTETRIGESYPYWTVIIRHPQTINRYVLYNRNDAVPERLLYFNLTSYAQDGSQVFTYKDQKTQPQYVYKIIPDVTSTSPVSNVTIRATYKRPADSSISGDPGDFTPVLTLCEVETYGDTICSQGTYGRECEHICDYCRNKICFVSTGGCPDGCADGYVGDKCQTPCPATFYGQDCKKICSTNCADQLCNNVNGVCNRCPPGKTGTLCNQDCPQHTYGQDCKMNCSVNCVDGLCDNVSGKCDQCSLGKIGDMCNQDCQATYFGQDCQQRCSTSCVDQLCDKINGGCDQCVLGKTGDMCNQDCPFTTYGQDCLQTCNTNCVDQDCNPVSGDCVLCPPGIIGDQWDQVCSIGSYGQSCQKKCSEYCVSPQDTSATSCDPVNGICVLGCIDGYLEPLCLPEASSDNPSSESDSSDLGVGIGIGAALMVVVVVVAVGVYCFMKRSRNTRSRRQRPPGYDETDFTRQDDHTYREMFKGNDDYNLPTDEVNSSIPANTNKSNAAYENTVVNPYDVITEETTRGEPDGGYVNDMTKTSGVDKTDGGYVNTAV